MTHLIMLFPGQGSQHTQMLMDFIPDYPVIKHTLEEGADAIGVDIIKLIQNSDSTELNLTYNTQPVLLASSIAIWRLMQEQLGSLSPKVAAGHSLGEYSALCASGAIDFVQAMQLVRSRGEIMDQAVPAGQGGMVALLGLSLEQVTQLCASIKQQHTGVIVEPANINAPGQIVVAGCAQGLDYLLAQAKEAGAKRALKLNVSGPFHSSLMQPPSVQFSERLQDINWQTPKFPVIHNANNQQAEVGQISEQLTRQLYSPVNWVENFEHCCQFAQTAVEVGAEKVLAGLNRRINKQIATLTTGNKEQFLNTIKQIEEMQ